jgi:hypothetical protein
VSEKRRQRERVRGEKIINFSYNCKRDFRDKETRRAKKEGRMQGNVREKTFHNIFPVPSDIGKEKVLERAKFLNVHFANELRSYEKKEEKVLQGLVSVT